jgi:hypothetical protein
LDNKQSWPNGAQTEAAASASIDLNELLVFLRSRLWMVLAILLACEALIAVASLLVTPEFQAESFVKMARVEGLKGIEGMILEKTRARLVGEPVSMVPRPQAGTALISASGTTSEEAVALAERATEALIEEGGKMVEEHRQIPQARLAMMQEVIAMLDADMRGVFSRGHANSEADPLAFIALSTTGGRLFEVRSQLYSDLIQEKLNLISDFSLPVRIDAPRALPQQTRPRWGRNLVLGAAFGVVFGTFVVVLLGVFRQLAAAPTR